MKRYIKKTVRGKTKRFIITFDEDGVVDTIERDGKLITAADPDAKSILRYSERLRAGILPLGQTGFEWDTTR